MYTEYGTPQPPRVTSSCLPHGLSRVATCTALIAAERANLVECLARIATAARTLATAADEASREAGA